MEDVVQGVKRKSVKVFTFTKIVNI